MTAIKAICDKKDLKIYKEDCSKDPLWMRSFSCYVITCKKYEMQWFMDGHITIFYRARKNKSIRPRLLYRPDLSVFKEGKIYSADKVLKFIEKLDKLQVFS